MEIRDDTWDVFKSYLETAVEYFEGYKNMDFEQCTIRDELLRILNHHPEDEKEGE